VIDIFMNYSWPGNVRELQNAIERMINFLKTAELTDDLIPDQIKNVRHPVEVREDLEPREETERRMIEKMLAQKIRKNRIAEKMNISRATLYRKMKQFELG
jgi:sigma-54 dependent transcriptional regulator, acetoin dehydrogenase operon transcriptional activator AcoR